MSSKKRVSVFARLGPAGPISPEESVPTHRRYSTDKHLEKGHHSLPPLPHPSHSHTTGREDSLRERERERKPSHQDYDDKKQLHYREPPPQPLSSSSRHRSHKHYHDDPEYLDDSKPMGRSEKRSSLPTPLPPPPPSWKSRDLADRLSPTGKDILSKPFMGHEDKLSKLSRGSVSSEGGGGGGGRVGSGVGKTKRTTPPEKRSSPPQEGGTESEGEAGEEDTRRKRPRTEKRAKPEGGVEDSRRASKTYQSEREREQRERERGGKERTDRDRHAWPEKPLPSSLVPAPEGGGGDTKESRTRPERGRTEEREGRRKRDDEWPEPRELGRKRKRDYSEADSTPPPESNKRVRTTDYQAGGSKEHSDSRPHPSEGNTLSHDDKHSRLPKEAESVDRKRRYEGSLDSNKELPPPKKPRSGESSSSRKYSRADPSSSSSSTGVRKKTERQHKEKAEQEHGGESGGEGTAKAPPKLDWSTISALSLPKPKPPSTSAVQRFSPGAIFSRLGVSRSLAGPDLYRDISSAVAKQLKKDQEALVAETGNSLPEDLLEDPFGKSEFAMTGVSWIKNAKENCQVCTNIGPCRRALVASVDFALRRKMGKSNKDLLPPSPSSGSWSSQQFASASLLYNSLGTKSSGKPAFRLEPSEVGSLLIPK